MSMKATQDLEKLKWKWPMVVQVAVEHLICCYTWVCIFNGRELITSAQIKKETIVLAFLLYVWGGFSITAGIHRLWAHRSYEATFPLKVFLMVGCSIHTKASIYLWGRLHRVHHAYSDTNADPHNAKGRGFFYSHIGWKLQERTKDCEAKLKECNVEDLARDPVVMFQHKWGLTLHYFFNYFVTTVYWKWAYDQPIVCSLLICHLRYWFATHQNMCVNSVLHAIGHQPYSHPEKDTHTARDSGLGAFISLGEGWHNYHHTFAWDYATAELGAMQQWNPTKVFIDCMVAIGLAWNPKKATASWEKRKQQWEQKNGRKFSEHLEGWPLFRVRVTCMGAEPYGEEDPRLLGTQISVEEQKAEKSYSVKSKEPEEGKHKVQ